MVCAGSAGSHVHARVAELVRDCNKALVLNLDAGLTLYQRVLEGYHRERFIPAAVADLLRAGEAWGGGT